MAHSNLSFLPWQTQCISPHLLSSERKGHTVINEPVKVAIHKLGEILTRFSPAHPHSHPSPVTNTPTAEGVFQSMRQDLEGAEGPAI